MSYDALAESVRLLEGAELPAVARLSRRVRYLPLAVDRDGDVAVTVFLRRGVSGLPLGESHTLERAGAGWRLLGGGGGPADAVGEPRPSLSQLGAPAVSPGGGGTASSRHGWISYAALRVAREVAVLQVGRRRLPVSAHGFAVVVWTGPTPAVTAQHPDVLEVAVIGVPDPVMGEKVGAVVLPRPGAHDLVPSLIAFARERLADFKVPQFVRVIDEGLPRNAGGKVLKTTLRGTDGWIEVPRR
jgi:hypothetical protein